MKSRGRKRTASKPSAHVARSARTGHPKESATALTGSAPAAALFYANLKTVAGRPDLDITGPDVQASLAARRDDVALEDKLGESPLRAVLAHAHDHTSWTPPHTLARRLETSCQKLPELVGDRLLGGLGRRPHDRLFPLGARMRKHAQVRLAWLGPARACLLQGQAKQL